jgi:DNA uptake protein ComE-like DNA-binding protein
MTAIKKWIRDLFGFSGNEINGFLILIPLMLLLVFSEPVYRAIATGNEETLPSDKRMLDSLLSLWDEKNTEQPDIEPFTLVEFDPNTAGVKSLQSLGFSSGLANRIAAYRLKGGTFRKKSDLLKIYGLDSTLYNQLYPYIMLPAETARGKVYKQDHAGGTKFEAAKRVNQLFDINMADTTVLKGIYGIGSKLAARIVKFRDGLGGFITQHQLREVYGLDSTVVDRLLKMSFVEEGFIPTQINLNSADEKKLSAHPYIRQKIARSLITYRFQHGDFQDVNDITKLPMLTVAEAERILPYVTVNDSPTGGE